MAGHVYADANSPTGYTYTSNTGGSGPATKNADGTFAFNGAPIPAGTTLDPSAGGNTAVGVQSPTLAPTQATGGAQAPGAANQNVPYASTTLGVNNNAPSIFGTGKFSAQPYAINDSAITGSPGAAGQDGNYGLNNIMGTLQNAVGANQVQNYAASSPTMQSAQGTAAQGTAAQGAAAQATAAQMAATGYGAATGSASGYGAGLGSASGYGASQGSASGYGAGLGSASSYGAALGNTAAGVNGVSGQASLAGSPALTGNVALGTQGYAQAASQQQQLANILGTQAAGGGVSPADLQLAQGEQQNIAGQLAVLGSQRGGMGNAALTARSAADQAAAAQMGLNQNMGIQRAQETLAAQNSLGSTLGTMGSQAQNQNINQAGLLQQSNLANQSALNTGQQFNAGQLQGMTTANMNAAQNANIYNASNAQQLQMGNLAAQNAAASQNAAQAQAMTGQNLNAMNSAAQYNAGNQQAMTTQNLNAANMAAQYNAGNQQAMTTQNLNAANTAAQYNAGNQQAMTGLNLGAMNAAASQNAAQAQAANAANMGAQNSTAANNQAALNAMTGANLNAQNTMGLQNLTNAQQTATQNVGNQQAANAANLAQAGQYGLSNQQAAITAQNQYMTNLLGLSGAQTGIAQSDKAAALANQQLQVQQQIANNQTNAQAYASAAQANANLTGAAIGAGGAVIGAGINAIGNAAGGSSTGNTTGVDTGTYNSDPATYSDENVKTGVEGGNPMLSSFLDQYRKATAPKAGIDPTVGENFRLSRTPSTSAAGSGASPVSGASQGFGDFLGILGPVGSIAGAVVGLGQAAFNQGASNPGGGASGGGVQASGEIGGGVNTSLEDPEWSGETSLSDDQAKENVISGNQGMQAFLEQANAQQHAQSQQGAQSNAFMQQGQAPSNATDRQLPQWLGPTSQGFSSFSGAGLAPGQSQAGGYQGGGSWNGTNGPGATVNAGGITQGSQQFNGGMTQGTQQFNGGMTQAPTQFNGGVTGGTSQFGGGMTQNAGISSQGGITQGPGMTSMGGMSSLGGYRPGSMATPSNPVPQTLMQPNTGSTALPTPGSLAMPAGITPWVQPLPAAPTLPVPGAPQPATQVSAGAGLGGVVGEQGQPMQQALPTLAGPVGTPNLPTFMRSGTTLSDEDEKTVDTANPDPQSLRDMMDQLHAHQYQYKDPDQPGAGHGTFVSPMAQELEKTPLGKSFVSKDANGTRMVNYGHMAGTMLAGQAMLHERVGTLERLLQQGSKS